MNPEFENWVNYILCQPRVVRRWLRYPIHKNDATSSLKTLLGEISSCPPEFCIFPDFVTFFKSDHVALRIPLCELSESDQAGIEDLRRNASKIFRKVEKLHVSRKIICRDFMYNNQFAIWRYDVIKACCIALLTSAHKRGILIPTTIVIKGALLHAKEEKLAIHVLPRIALTVMGHPFFGQKPVATIKDKTVELLENSALANETSVQSSLVEELDESSVHTTSDISTSVQNNSLSNGTSVHGLLANESSVQNGSLANETSVHGLSVSESSVQELDSGFLDQEDASVGFSESFLPAMCDECGGGVEERKTAAEFKQELLDGYVDKYFGQESAADKARWRVLFLAYAADRLNIASFLRREERWILDAFEAFTNGEPVATQTQTDKLDGVKSSWYVHRMFQRSGLLLRVCKRNEPWITEALQDTRFLFGGLAVSEMPHPDPENACGGEVGAGWWAGKQSMMVTPAQHDYQASLVIAFLAGRPLGHPDGTFYPMATAMRWIARHGDPILAWFAFAIGWLPACHDDRRAMIKRGPPTRCRDRKNWQALVDACDAYVAVDKLDASHPTQVVFRAIVNFVSPDADIMFSTSFKPRTVRLVDLQGKSRNKNKLLRSVVKLKGKGDVDTYWERLLQEGDVEGMASLVTNDSRNTEIDWDSVFAPFESWPGCFASHFNGKYQSDFTNFVPVDYDFEDDATGNTTVFGDALMVAETVVWAREPVESLDSMLSGRRMLPVSYIHNFPIGKDITIDNVKVVRDSSLVSQEKSMDFLPIKARPLAYPSCECKRRDGDFDQRLFPFGIDKQKDRQIDTFVREGEYGGMLTEPRAYTEAERKALFDGITDKNFLPLRPGFMLTGTLIEFYRCKLLAQLERLSAGKKKVHIFHTAFFNTDPKNWHATPRKFDLFALEHVFFLLHSAESNHFFLAHVDLEQKRLRFYDSMGNSENYKEFANKIRFYLKQHHMDRKGFPLSLKGWEFKTHPERIANYMQSIDGNDCGCWMLRTVEHIIMGWPLTDMGNMDDYRLHIYQTIAPQKKLETNNKK